MLDYLKPSLYVKKISLISVKHLLDKGIKAIIIDLDNTITEWNSHDLLADNINWFKSLEENEIRVCIASNNDCARVSKVAGQLNIPAIHKACKPRRKSFREAMRVLGSEPKNTAVIGDQIFTDILGGNRLNLYTILVAPIGNKEFIGTKITRFFEGMILKRCFKEEENDKC